jgi:hypothetical protein
MYQNTIKLCCETSTRIFSCHELCSEKMAQQLYVKSGLRRVDLHNGLETTAPFANNGTVMVEE